MLFLPGKPIELDAYVRRCRLRSFLLRCALALVLLFAVFCIKSVSARSAATVRAWVLGTDSLDSALSVFFERVSDGASAADAVSAFCRTLDHEAP